MGLFTRTEATASAAQNLTEARAPKMTAEPEPRTRTPKNERVIEMEM